MTFIHTELSEEDLSLPLNKASDAQLQGIATLVGTKFLPFGLELEFQEQEIDVFKKDYKFCYETTKGILRKWMSGSESQATWMSLGDVLNEIGVGVRTLPELYSN